MDVGIKRNWSSVSGHKVLFTLTHQEKERQRDRRAYKITNLNNAYSQDLSLIKVSALLCFIL